MCVGMELQPVCKVLTLARLDKLVLLYFSSSCTLAYLSSKKINGFDRESRSHHDKTRTKEKKK